VQLRGRLQVAIQIPSVFRIPVRAIPVYTETMKVVKVRRVGNSNVISIPREFEAQGYVPGASVLVEELAGGELRIISTDTVRERIRGRASGGRAQRSSEDPR
jgi:hypothetical protein